MAVIAIPRCARSQRGFFCTYTISNFAARRRFQPFDQSAARALARKENRQVADQVAVRSRLSHKALFWQENILRGDVLPVAVKDSKQNVLARLT
ncbi:hypothetical protein [uncultured Tateyamaria sp.]|uniref:hypothetical protein n=1 Tax=uncultured Tateyamaria sp. TaxID=455651 RepID=UPI002614A60C|nr:hypothetical protein [uncultured Tateyamaria sp.]